MKLLKSVRRTAAFFLVVLASIGWLEGATTWTGGDGDWATPGNWDAGLPASDIDAIIGLTRDVTVNSDQTAKSLTINGDSIVALSLSPSSTLTLNAGETYDPALFVNDNSTLNLSDGTIKVTLGQVFIGGTSTNGSGDGTVNMSGGVLDFDEVASGSYAYMVVGRNGATGAFNQSGGGVITGGALMIGLDSGTGNYNLSGSASLATGDTWNGTHIYIGLTQSGGQTGTEGTLTISDNATFTVGGHSYLHIGDNLNGGTAYAGGSGKIVQQDNSTVSLGGDFLAIGSSFGGTGEYDLEGGSLTISATTAVIAAEAGSTGTLNQTGGTLTIAAGHALNFGSGTGSYNLNGGTLEIGGNNPIGGAGAFNLGGGTLKVVGSDLLESLAPVLQTGTTSIINTNGLNATFSNGLAGTGGISKSGAGSLILGGSSTLGLDSAVEGTLAVGVNNATPGSLGLADGVSLKASATATVRAIVNVGVGAGVSGTLSLAQNAELLLDPTASSETGTSGAGLRVGYLAGTGVVNIALGALVEVSDSSSVSYGGISVGYGAGSTGTINQAGGEFYTGGAFNLGVVGASGTYNLSGGILAQHAVGEAGTRAGRHVYIGDGAGGIGDLNITGTGQFRVDATTYVDIGQNSGSGKITQNGSDTVVTIGGDFFAVGSGSVGAYDLKAGDLNVNNGWFYFGNYNGAGGAGTLLQSGGVLTANVTTYIGYGTDSTGEFSLSGGTATLIGGLRMANSASSQAEVNLTGGVLEIGGNNGLSAGAGAYAFNLGGGTIKVVGSNLTTSINGNLIEGGASTIDTNGFDAAWSGNLIGQGDHQIDWGGSSLTKKGVGNLTFSGSSRVLDTFAVTGGTVRQTAGATSSVEFMTGSGNGSIAEYILDGGSILVSPSTKASNGAEVAGTLRVGDFGGVGTFTQNAGSVTLADNGAFNIGNQGGTGTYTLNGGTVVLNVGNHVIGRSDTGKPDSHGTLNIAGGTLTVQGTGALIIGNNLKADGSTGELTQTGGVLHVDNDSSLWLSALSQGVYNLNGGTLEIGGDSLLSRYPSGTASANFNLGGGTIKVIGSSLTTSAVPTLTAATTSTVNTNGFNATFSSNIAGPGTLHKTGAGTLNLNGAGTAAQIVVVEGILSGTGSTTGGILVQSGATLAGNLQAGGVTEIAAGGTFSPGFSPVAVYNSGSLTLDGTLYLEIGGTNGVTSFTTSPVTGQYDQLLYEGAIDLGSNASIVIEGLAGYTPQEGDTFNLLLSNTGITIDPSVSITLLGTLGGYAFDLSPDGSTLSLTIGAIPEPSPIVLAMLGLTGVGLIRRVRRSGKKLRHTI